MSRSASLHLNPVTVNGRTRLLEVSVRIIDQREMNHCRSLWILFVLKDVYFLLRLSFQTGEVGIREGDVVVFTVSDRLLQHLNTPPHVFSSYQSRWFIFVLFTSQKYWGCIE